MLSSLLGWFRSRPRAMVNRKKPWRKLRPEPLDERTVPSAVTFGSALGNTPVGSDWGKDIMLKALMSGKWLRTLLCALAVLLGGVKPVGANAKVYRKAVPCTVLLWDGKSVASGVLVDIDRRLVVTAAHVVTERLGNATFDVKVTFPESKNGRVITSDVYYIKKSRLTVPGRIIYANRLKDLAFIQLAHLPAGAAAIPVAVTDPEPGETIHVVGNSEFGKGGAFGYAEGRIRNVYNFRQYGYEFKSVAHHAPTNRGDSGGAVVDDAGKLLAIISQGTTGSGEGLQLYDNSVHFSEIQRALQFTQQPSGKNIVVQAAVDSTGKDEFYFPVTKNTKVEAKLTGLGTTDLDLFAEDVDFPKGFLIKEEGLTDQEKGTFKASWSGYACVLVRNLPNAANQYELSIDGVGLSDAGNRLDVPLTCIRRIAACGEDIYQFHYQKGKGAARISIRGDGDTELNVAVEDPNRNVVARAKCREECADAEWMPAVNGQYTVRIRNLGKTWNRYVLTTD